MNNLEIYQQIDLLGNLLDALCEKYPDMYPDSFRKQKYIMGMKWNESIKKLGEAFIKSLGMSVFEFSQAIDRNEAK